MSVKIIWFIYVFQEFILDGIISWVVTNTGERSSIHSLKQVAIKS
jgi:hypothetical protein